MSKEKVGYGIFPQKIANFYDKVSRGVPGATSDLAAKAAQIALSDQNFVIYCRQWTRDNKQKILTTLKGKNYIIPETNEYCPIFILGHTDKNVDMREVLIKKGILSASGSHFDNLGKNFVRITIPSDSDEFVKRIST